jgi:hypothetical protein
MTKASLIAFSIIGLWSGVVAAVRADNHQFGALLLWTFATVVFVCWALTAGLLCARPAHARGGATS